jgi:hypothetical protein
MKVDITQIILGLITIMVGLADAFLIPWLKAKVGSEKLAKIIDTIDIFVAAAEQIAARDGYDGAWKKAHVIALLEKNGFTVDETIDEYIEAAVIKLHNELISVGE